MICLENLLQVNGWNYNSPEVFSHIVNEFVFSQAQPSHASIPAQFIWSWIWITVQDRECFILIFNKFTALQIDSCNGFGSYYTSMP